MSLLASPAAERTFIAQDRLFTGPPIFVSGCNRGGTTILARVLALHPEVRNVGRGQFCEGQFIWKRRYRDWSRHRWAIRPWVWFMRRSERHATPEQLAYFRAAFETAMDGPGRMLEKTPANAVRIPFINALYPNCCFVHLLRDGRHTTASLVARRVWLPYAPHQWVGAHRTALADLAAVPESRVLVLRYEDLLARPEAALEEVFTRCGLGWGSKERAAVMGPARAMLCPPEDRWMRMARPSRRYVLRVIGDLQRELDYPVDLES